MFDPSSRYRACSILTHTTREGREIEYVARRFIDASVKDNVRAELSVNDGDRIDLLTARTLGDPLQYWKLCDTNEAFAPSDLTAEPGRKLKVPSPV